MPEKIGFVGLGIMGRPMALNLSKAGYEVHAFDIFPEAIKRVTDADARVKAAASCADAARKGDIIITMVQDGPQARQAITGKDGVLDGAARGKLIVDMSSIAPSVSQEIGKACAAKGVGFLDGPVSGGEPGAINAALAIMVGGNASDFERAKPVFDKLGKSSVLCGQVGAGQVVKLANQIVVGLNILAVAEALVLAQKAGVNPETVFEAIKGGLAGSTVMNAKAPMMFNRNFQPGFRIELHYKDINNAMQAAREMQVPLQATANLQQILTSLVLSGDGKLDHSGILHFVEKQAGVEVRKK